MAESTLSLQLSDLAAAVGFYLGYNRTPASWSGWQAASPYVASGPDTQLADILITINVGMRMFYFHKPLPSGEGQDVMLQPLQPPHRWSFLCPERTLTTVIGQTDYPLPDDFKAFLGDMVYSAVNSGAFATVGKTSSGDVRMWTALASSGRAPPSRFAEVPRQTDGAQGQRFNVVFFPVPDAAYTLTYRSEINPPALSAQNPYPYGGSAHGETILEACLAAAENRLMDVSAQDPSAVHLEAFQRLLQASIAQDTRDHWSDLAGYDGGRTDRARSISANRNSSAAAKKRDPRLAGL